MAQGDVSAQVQGLGAVKCCVFDGSSKLTGDSSQYLFGASQDFSVSCLFRTTADHSVGGGAVLCVVGNVGTNKYWAMMISGANKFEANIYDGVTNKSATSNDVVNDGLWKMGTMVCDRDGNMNIYVNGSVQTNEEDISGLGDITDGADASIYFGEALGAGAYWYDGYMGKVRIWNRVLTAEEALQEYRYWILKTGTPVTGGLISQWNLTQDYLDTFGKNNLTNSGTTFYNDESWVELLLHNMRKTANDHFLLTASKGQIVFAGVEEA